VHSLRYFCVILLATFAFFSLSFSVSGGNSDLSKSQSGSQQTPSTHGNASQRAIVNFAGIADRERLAPPAQRPRAIHEPLQEEEESDKTIPPGAYAPTDAGSGAIAELTTPSPPLASSFLALDDNNTAIPPDTYGAVSPNYLMVTLNSQVRIQTRNGSTLSTVSLTGFWSVFGHSNIFDPRVLFDPYNSRWIFVCLTDFRTATSSLQIGVSQSADPTGNWNLYDIDFDSANVNFADYPNVGINRNWITVTANSYRVSDKGFVASSIYVFNKASLYAGSGSPYSLFQDASGHSQTPALTYDNALSTMYIIENWNGNSSGSGSLRLSTITGAVGSEVLTLGIAFPSTPNPWDSAPPGGGDFAPQLGSSQRIVAGDADVQNVVYRNGSLWCTQTVFLPAGGAATRSSIQWWQLATNGAIQQRGRIDDASGNTFYAYPSIAVNQNSDALIGYSRFSASQYAGAGYAFRAASDPAGTLRTSATLKDGQAPYYKINGGTRNKWGDFSNSSIDPLNDTDFWTIQEYAALPSGSVDRWGTWWGRIVPSAPPPPPANDIVLYAADAPVRVGNWQVVADATAAGGSRIFNPDAGADKLVTPLANPANYFEMTFPAQSATAYHLWMRGKALNDFWGNDSVFIQFSDSVDSGGTSVYRIGTTDATTYNLEDCSGCGLSGWGWQDNGWGIGVLGANIYFQTTGTHTLRIQVREDGLSLDQIVLSPATYLNTPPGALRNDTTILPRSGTPPPAPPPTVSSVNPNSGSTSGGTNVTINGSNFVDGATVSFGGTSASNVNVASSTSITSTTPAHAAGAVSVTVTNPDGQSATLGNGFTYTISTPPPTITSITPNSGTTAGGTSVTISGSNFVSGASVGFGGVASTNVTVINSSSISAITPAHTAGTVNVVVTNRDGQSGTLTNGYSYVSSPPTETILLVDDFNNNSLDTSKWAVNNLFSGYTDASLPAVEVNQQFEIGAMLTGASGSHYNGIRSVAAYNFSGAYCYVVLTRAPASNTTADAMFTIGKDVDNYYRIYVEAGVLYLLKRIQATKTTLATRTYDSVNQRYLRIRHDSTSGAVVFEAAPDNGGVPGTWTVLYSEAWNTTNVSLTAIIFELKGGTWQSETNAAGKVIFDNFKAARP
jgi:hypothetical protein